jgi:hypothetical protein
MTCWLPFFPTSLPARKTLSATSAFLITPLIREVMNDVLTEVMDLKGLEGILQGIYDGRQRTNDSTAQ